MISYVRMISWVQVISCVRMISGIVFHNDTYLVTHWKIIRICLWCVAIFTIVPYNIIDLIPSDDHIFRCLQNYLIGICILLYISLYWKLLVESINHEIVIVSYFLDVYTYIWYFLATISLDWQLYIEIFLKRLYFSLKLFKLWCSHIIYV